jgi:hypothetical protein
MPPQSRNSFAIRPHTPLSTRQNLVEEGASLGPLARYVNLVGIVPRIVLEGRRRQVMVAVVGSAVSTRPASRHVDSTLETFVGVYQCIEPDSTFYCGREFVARSRAVTDLLRHLARRLIFSYRAGSYQVTYSLAGLWMPCGLCPGSQNLLGVVSTDTSHCESTSSGQNLYDTSAQSFVYFILCFGVYLLRDLVEHHCRRTNPKKNLEGGRGRGVEHRRMHEFLRATSPLVIQPAHTGSLSV